MSRLQLHKTNSTETAIQKCLTNICTFYILYIYNDVSLVCAFIVLPVADMQKQKKNYLPTIEHVANKPWYNIWPRILSGSTCQCYVWLSESSSNFSIFLCSIFIWCLLKAIYCLLLEKLVLFIYLPNLPKIFQRIVVWMRCFWECCLWVHCVMYKLSEK